MRFCLACSGAFLLIILAQVSAAQALAGVYTCANGNPGNAFDYANVGDFFDELETFGVSGPTTLELYDDGGPYVATLSWLLGADGRLSLAPDDVPGLSAANPLTIRAAAGETPEITGAGAPFAYLDTYLGALSFADIGNVTIEGLTIRDCGFGIIFHNQNVPAANVRIARCRIYNADMQAIFFSGYSSTSIGSQNVTIENNMVWACVRVGNVPLAYGAIGARNAGPNFVIRHNTVMHHALSSSYGAYFYHGGTSPLARFENNITYMTSAQSYVYFFYTSTTLLPLVADGNVFYTPATTIYIAAGSSFTQWQTGGRDLNGVFADPMFVSTATGSEDLHLQPGSPAIDRCPPGPVLEDVDGHARPYGSGAESGADEVGPLRDIEVAHQLTVIPNGWTAPMGPIDLLGAQFTLSIANIGLGTLSLTAPVTVTPGLNCSSASQVVAQPPSTAIVGLSSVSFTVKLVPLATGPTELSVTIRSDDPADDPFTFVLAGTGAVLNGDPVCAAPGGSLFTGPPNGPLVAHVNPGAGVNNAVLTLSDPDSDQITVTSIAPSGAAPAGIAAPSAPAPGHPLSITFGGTALATNAPGQYTWTITFHDAHYGTTIQCVAAITINDLPPTHAIAGASGGNGSFLSPYTASFLVGDGPGAGIDLATLADPNTGQALTVAGMLPQPSNPAGGVGFQFSLSGNALRVAPGGTLSGSDVGTHEFDVFVADAQNTVAIRVALMVAPTTNPAIVAPANLPDAEVGKPYSYTFAQTGAAGAISWSIVAGTLPTGLALDTTTGELSGAPTESGKFSFEVRVVDAANQWDSAQATLRVVNQNTPKDGNSAEEDSGCSGAGSHLPIALLAMLLLLWTAQRRKRLVAM